MAMLRLADIDFWRQLESEEEGRRKQGCMNIYSTIVEIYPHGI